MVIQTIFIDKRAFQQHGKNVISAVQGFGINCSLLLTVCPPLAAAGGVVSASRCD